MGNYQVYIVGAGPGDPELVTIKAANALKKATVILVDRLVNPAIISHYASPEAKTVYVGKNGLCKQTSTRNADIRRMMVEYAQQGETVVRLKGGDISVYAQLKEEVQALKEHKLSYQLIPGISAAFGGAADAELALTAKAVRKGIKILSLSCCASKQECDELEIKELEHETWICYMSARRIEPLFQRIAESQLQDIWATVIEHATLPHRKITNFNLKNYRQHLNREWESPSIVYIGKELGNELALN